MTNPLAAMDMRWHTTATVAVVDDSIIWSV